MEFVSAFVRYGEWVDVADRLRVCRDPKDNMFLELAVSGHAFCIITSDEDLLTLRSFRGMKIMTPRQFHENPLTGTGNP
jgi:predicted nucleic acid-binding protein